MISLTIETTCNGCDDVAVHQGASLAELGGREPLPEGWVNVRQSVSGGEEQDAAWEHYCPACTASWATWRAVHQVSRHRNGGDDMSEVDDLPPSGPVPGDGLVELAEKIATFPAPPDGIDRDIADAIERRRACDEARTMGLAAAAGVIDRDAIDRRFKEEGPGSMANDVSPTDIR